jgi:hypothetical protein
MEANNLMDLVDEKKHAQNHFKFLFENFDK